MLRWESFQQCYVTLTRRPRCLSSCILIIFPALVSLYESRNGTNNGFLFSRFFFLNNKLGRLTDTSAVIDSNFGFSLIYF